MATRWQRFKSFMAFRAAVGSLRRRRGFVVATLATFALGTSSTTTVFTLVDTVLIKPLPYPKPIDW